PHLPRTRARRTRRGAGRPGGECAGGRTGRSGGGDPGRGRPPGAAARTGGRPMMVALVSTHRSPGASVSALALTLAATRNCLLAECDPAGGDVLAGYLQGTLPAHRGLAPLAVA